MLEKYLVKIEIRDVLTSLRFVSSGSSLPREMYRITDLLIFLKTDNQNG